MGQRRVHGESCFSIMAVLRLIALVSSLCVAAVFAANVRCGRNTHKHVWIQPDDQFIFQTQRRGKPYYEDNTRCSVRYTPYGNCSEVGFTCDKMSLRAEGGSRCRGDYVALKLPGERLDKYCSGMKPNVTSTGFMRVVFRSNKDRRVQGGARCLVECSNNSTSRSLDVLTNLLDQLAEEQSFAEESDFEEQDE